MNVQSVEISNFRSIKNQTFAFASVSDRTCSILLGKNESGKSNILKAIALLDETYLADINYAVDCNKDAEKEEDSIEIRYSLDLANFKFYTKKFVEDGMHIELVMCIQPIAVHRCITIEKNNAKENSIDINLKENGKFSKFVIKGDEIKPIVELYSGNEVVNASNVTVLVGEGWKILSKISLELFLQKKYYEFIDERIPNVVYWEYDEKYLINQRIDLNIFKDKNGICIPLRNVFHIAGIDKIKERLELVSNSPEKRKQLEDELSKSITRYINGVWKEHEINVRVDIESMQCSIMIEDKDNAAPKYSMNQRSDGFKQFISILLNLSAENSTDKLKNKIILLDEPEVHLHPSGIRFLRDELLNIAKNNVVVIATHSIFMIDKKNLNRHYGVHKEGSVTTVERLSDENPYQDEVVYEALGTSIYELVQENMIIFEGKIDRDLFDAFTKKYVIDFKPANYGSISADGVEKIPNYTKFLNRKMVSGFVITDSDKAGQGIKKKVLEEDGFTNKNVFEIRDLATSVPEGATVEDLLPKEVIIKCITKQWNLVVEIDENKAVMKQIETKNKDLKGKLDPDEVKAAIIQAVLADVKSLNKADCKEKYGRYVKFITEMHKRIKA